PVAPFVPAVPVAPVAPVGPADPAGPVTPVVPVGPAPVMVITNSGSWLVSMFSFELNVALTVTVAVFAVVHGFDAHIPIPLLVPGFAYQYCTIGVMSTTTNPF